MGTRAEIEALEEQLRQAELGPDPAFFQRALAEEAVLVGEDGRASMAKAKVVAAHQPATAPKFTRVEMRDMQIADHGNAAVVTCSGSYTGPMGTVTLKFMRVWLKRDGQWQIIAGSVAR